MAERRRYDDNFRASAVVMLEAAGYPDRKGALTQVAKKIGVPLNTLKGWATDANNPVPADVRTEKKGELVSWITSELGNIFDAMNTVRADASYRDLATAAGILIDKKQLITGNPTSNDSQKLSIEYVNDWREA